jgi:hypothetical protein
MARGKKYNDDIKEKAFALLAVSNNVQYVADELGLKYSTVKTWEKQFLAKSKELDEKQGENPEGGEETITNSDELDLVKLRKKKKEEFVNDSWNLIGKIKTLLERRLDRAIGSENVIDELLAEITSLDRKELTDAQRKSLYMKISTIKVESVKELSVVLGTLYDKQALANKEATSIVEGNIGVRKFEDL